MTARQSSGMLYAEDFYLWTQQQAALLRTGQWQELDYENLAEEIESVGRSAKRELGNRLEVLLAHLLKWQYQPEGRREGTVGKTPSGSNGDNWSPSCRTV
jgi:hypothetical protein